MWQTAASPSCHLSRQRMHSSAASAAQAHSPASEGKLHDVLMLRYITVGCHVPSNVPLLALFMGIWTPSNTRFLQPTSRPPKWHLDRFSPFCTAHLCGQLIQTDHTLCDICSNKPHLCTECSLKIHQSICAIAVVTQSV